MRPTRESDLLRLTSWIEVDFRGCWIFTGVHNWRGYGQFTYRGSKVMAHRAAWQILVGPIGPGLQLDHLCRVRDCVNPDHLEPVTHLVNIARGYGIGRRNGERSACNYGHPFDATNTYFPQRGGRQCKTCKQQAHQRYSETRSARRALARSAR